MAADDAKDNQWLHRNLKTKYGGRRALVNGGVIGWYLCLAASPLARSLPLAGGAASASLPRRSHFFCRHSFSAAAANLWRASSFLPRMRFLSRHRGGVKDGGHGGNSGRRMKCGK